MSNDENKAGVVSDFNRELGVGDVVLVIAKVDNCGYEGIIEAIDNSKRNPVKVVFHEFEREDDAEYGFHAWCCYKHEELKFVKSSV